MWPEQSNPTETRLTTRRGLRKEVRAVAPYNFVPLPENVIFSSGLPDQSEYTGESGYITCRLTTLTPLYTRTAMTPERFAEYGDDIRKMMADDAARREYAQFFHINDEQRPVIPGSSLRGMIRNLVEIISFGRMPWVTDKQLFFRTMDNTSVGDHYRDRMMDKVEAGLLRKQGERTYIERWDYVRVGRDKLVHNANSLYDGTGPMKTPKWSGSPHQYQKIWVTLTPSGLRVEDVRYQPAPGYQEGILVITGDIQKKEKEFVLLKSPGSPVEVEVPDDLLNLFLDDDQISLWQQRAFPNHKPAPDSRQRHGALRTDSHLAAVGDPVFFLREGGALIFFGRAHMFRLPYANSPRNFVPEKLLRGIDDAGEDMLDLADAIFGYVPESGRTHSAAGRVFFCDATCTSTGDIWLQPQNQSITPKILASPKPTAFQQYLVQDKERFPPGQKGYAHDPDVKDALAHYGTPSPAETVIRGYKLYWHKEGPAQVSAESISTATPPNDWNRDTQHTQIRPVKAGVSFEFRIYYENLRDYELGALLWALKLPIAGRGNVCRHKLGMGKPLGLGSVEIDCDVISIDRKSRYAGLFDDQNWLCSDSSLPEVSPKEERTPEVKSVSGLLQAFEQYLLNQLYPGSTTQPVSLSKHTRIEMLAALLAWPGPSAEFTRYMEIRRVDPGENERTNWYNEFQPRPVLPDPIHIDAPLVPDSGRTRTTSTGMHTVYSDSAQAMGDRQSSIDPDAVLNRMSGQATEDRKDEPVASAPFTPTTGNDLAAARYIWATVSKVHFNAVMLEAGTTGIEGRLSDNEMTDEVRPHFADYFEIGKMYALWIRDVNQKKKRLFFTMRNPSG